MAKKEKVQEMFNGIAPKYDLLNHLLSMGIDKSWRKKAMKVVGAGRKDWCWILLAGREIFRSRR